MGRIIPSARGTAAAEVSATAREDRLDIVLSVAGFHTGLVSRHRDGHEHGFIVHGGPRAVIAFGGQPRPRSVLLTLHAASQPINRMASALLPVDLVVGCSVQGAPVQVDLQDPAMELFDVARRFEGLFCLVTRQDGGINQEKAHEFGWTRRIEQFDQNVAFIEVVNVH